MRLTVIVTLALLFGCIMAAEAEVEATYEIDDALEALTGLRDDTALTLYNLQKGWAVVKDGLQDSEKQLQNAINSKDAECAADEKARDQTKSDLDEINAYIPWLEQKIANITDNLNGLLARRCELNKAFLDHIQREKVALSLLEFIKSAIQNKDSFDFIQMKKLNKQFQQFLVAYNSHDFSSILLLQKDIVDSKDYEVDVDFSTKDRTADEIGTGHIDNNKGDIDLEDFTEGKRKNWQLYKQELLDILSELQAKIQANIKKSIDDEIAASVTLANYKNSALKEIQTYEKELAKAKKQAVQLQAQLDDEEAALTQCRSQDDSLKSQLQSLQNEIQQRQAEFDKKYNDLEGQVQLFNEIITEYQDGIFSQGDDFKSRTDDYLDNQTFDDDATYTGREVPKIDFMNNQDANGSAGF
ncbi:hypothetical protein ABPG74_018861 [Tetrahymena malaccensis]